MADTKTDKEPSIEEILESIRQIISEDGDSGKAAAVIVAPPTAAAPPPPPPPPPPPAPKKKEEVVLELTDRVMPHTSDLDLSPKPEPAMTDNGALLSDDTASAGAAAMAKLLQGNVAVERVEPGRVGNVTLEDMARELMRPLIKTWLDQNLPGVIEKMVQKEIEKLSRRAGG